MPALIEDARNRGDIYSEVNLPLLTSFYSSYLISGDADGATKRIEELLPRWPHQGFDIQRFYALNAMVDLDLYRGDAACAWERARSAWPDVKASGLRYITLLRTFGDATRARAALAVASQRGTDKATRDRLLRFVLTIAKSLQRSKTSYAGGLGLLLIAGVASTRGQRTAALNLLLEAEIALELAELIPWLAMARLRLADLLSGDQADRVRATAEAWIRSQNIDRADHLAQMLVPGRWTHDE